MSSNVGIQNEKIIAFVVAEDGSLSSISRNSSTTSVDTEFLIQKEGRSHNLGKMGATDMHPSPVSVLDLPFEKDEAMTPSSITLGGTSISKFLEAKMEEEIKRLHSNVGNAVVETGTSWEKVMQFFYHNLLHTAVMKFVLYYVTIVASDIFLFACLL